MSVQEKVRKTRRCGGRWAVLVAHGDIINITITWEFYCFDKNEHGDTAQSALASCSDRRLHELRITDLRPR